MAEGHNKRERTLFTDIGRRNNISNRIRRLSGRIDRWVDRIERKRGARWQKQYGTSILRASEHLEPLEGELVRLGEELRARIQEEIKVSEGEIRAFEEQYKREVEDIRKAVRNYESARQALHLAEARAAGRETPEVAAVLKQMRAKLRRASSRSRTEAGEVGHVEQELTSEAADKAVLTRELERIVAELQATAG